MSEPPLGEGPGATPEGVPQPPADPGSPDYAGAPADAPRRGGAHRASGRPTPPPPPPAGAPYWPVPDYQPDEPVGPSRADAMSSRLLLGGVALIALIALLALLYYLFAPATTTGDTAAGNKTTATATTTSGTGSTTSGSATPTAPTTKPTTTAATSKPATSKPGAATTTAKPTGQPTSKPTSQATTKPATVPPPKATTKPPDVKVPLVVLNNSRIHGLAVTGANDFRNGGWTVLSTGNFRGRLPESTVYYSPGNKAAAETLARQFPSITAVKPKPAGLGGGPLTVVLTRDFKS